jgi:hypothetical protein
MRYAKVCRIAVSRKYMLKYTGEDFRKMFFGYINKWPQKHTNKAAPMRPVCFYLDATGINGIKRKKRYTRGNHAAK